MTTSETPTRVIQCRSCVGRGHVCPVCLAPLTPPASCTKCAQDAAPCSICGGTGERDVPEDRIIECPDCGGDGYVCPDCGVPVQEDDICEGCGEDGECCDACQGTGEVEI